MNIILFGPPGSGKGTQSKKLAEAFGYTQLSTGDLVRKEIASGTAKGNEIQRIVEQGGLPSDELIVELVEEQFDPSTPGFVFDGFPRTLNQAEVLAKMLVSHHQEIDIIIALKIADEEIKKRILGRFSCAQCGAIYNKYFNTPKVNSVCDVCEGTEFITRSDDTEEAIVNRLATYYALTEPVLEFYQKRGGVVEVDASQDADCVFADIQALIAKAQGNKN
jgi:adenylate kinases